MESSETTSKIAEALSKAQSQFKSVEKSGNNDYDKYEYAKLEDYVKACRAVLAENNLSIITSVDETVTLPDRPTKGGGLNYAVRVKMTVRVIHTSGEWIQATCWGEGQDRADKATYKAITGGRKYALASVLGLATTDDPESDEGGGEGQAPQTTARSKPQTPAKRNVAPKVQLTEAAGTFLKNYCDLMNKRGCKTDKAKKILNDMLVKRNTSINDLTGDAYQGIIAKVSDGSWDQYFKSPERKAA